jgi:hypothetical protein
MVVSYKDRFESLKRFETLRDVEDPVPISFPAFSMTLQMVCVLQIVISIPPSNAVLQADMIVSRIAVIIGILLSLLSFLNSLAI